MQRRAFLHFIHVNQKKNFSITDECASGDDDAFSPTSYVCAIREKKRAERMKKILIVHFPFSRAERCCGVTATTWTRLNAELISLWRPPNTKDVFSSSEEYCRLSYVWWNHLFAFYGVAKLLCMLSRRLKVAQQLRLHWYVFRCWMYNIKLNDMLLWLVPIVQYNYEKEIDRGVWA